MYSFRLLAIVPIVLGIAACGNGGNQTAAPTLMTNAVSPTTTISTEPPVTSAATSDAAQETKIPAIPAGVDVSGGCLLSPDEINTATGRTSDTLKYAQPMLKLFSDTTFTDPYCGYSSIPVKDIDAPEWWLTVYKYDTDHFADAGMKPGQDPIAWHRSNCRADGSEVSSIGKSAVACAQQIFVRGKDRFYVLAPDQWTAQKTPAAAYAKLLTLLNDAVHSRT